LTSLKGKLLNVSKIGLLSPTSEEVPVATPPAVVNAGTAILTHFQQQWAELHELNEDNAKNAAKLAESISIVHAKVSRDYNNIVEITQLLNAPPTLDKSVDSCLAQIRQLQHSFETTERSLLDLEDAIEALELEKKKVDHKYQLALYKEKKLLNFEKARSDLQTKHTQTLMDQEIKQKKMLEERQQVFAEAFSNDLETYRSLGTIPKIETNVQSSALLEEIQLDLDQQDLETFLNAK